MAYLILKLSKVILIKLNLKFLDINNLCTEEVDFLALGCIQCVGFINFVPYKCYIIIIYSFLRNIPISSKYLKLNIPK